MTDGANPRVFQPGLVPQTPPPAEGSEGGEGNPPAEPTPEPVKVFVGGRERTVEEVVAGYAASTAEAARFRADRDALATERDALRREADAYRAQLTRVPEPQLPELGEDPDPQQLAAWVGAVAEKRAGEIAAERVRSVEEKFDRFIGAAQQFGTAQAQMKQLDANFNPDQLSVYLVANPDVQQRYNAIFAVDQTAALEYGWGKAKGSGTVQPPDEPRVVQQPSKRKAPAPTAEGTGAERKRRLEEAERTGNYEAYYAWRAKGTSMELPGLK